MGFHPALLAVPVQLKHRDRPKMGTQSAPTHLCQSQQREPAPRPRGIITDHHPRPSSPTRPCPNPGDRQTDRHTHQHVPARGPVPHLHRPPALHAPGAASLPARAPCLQPSAEPLCPPARRGKDPVTATRPASLPSPLGQLVCRPEGLLQALVASWLGTQPQSSSLFSSYTWQLQKQMQCRLAPSVPHQEFLPASRCSRLACQP